MLVAVVAVAAVVAAVTVQRLSSAAPTAHGQPIDGVRCDKGEQLAYHVHAHLAVFTPDGQAMGIPSGIGIPGANLTQAEREDEPVTSGTCFYWIHTHTENGIVHVESPAERSFTLGQLFDIWGQPLTAGQVSFAQGPVTAFVNGAVWAGPVRAIPLADHEVIQLDVGRATPFQNYSFAADL